MLGQRRRQGSAWAYRIPIWGTVLIVAGLLYLDNSPVVLEAERVESPGAPVTRKRPSDVVCVLSYRAISESEATFRDHDWSAAWVDLLEQHLGPISVVTPESLSIDHLDQARAIVLTASVSDAIPEDLASRLREYALDGSLLVVERPEGHLREMFSANGDAGIQIGRGFTFAQGISDPYKSQLLEMPLDTEYVGSTSPREGATSLLAIDGAPVVYAAEVGQGTVVTVDFDLGEQLVAMQQGRPTEDFRVPRPPSRPGRPLVPRTDQLVADDELRGSRVPYADLLERFIVHGVIRRYAHPPGFWPFPQGAAGVVVPLHPDDRLGDVGGWMLEYETSRDATSTLLTSVDAGLTAAGAAVVDRRGGDLGLLWKPTATPVQLTQSYGFWGLEPVAQPIGLEKQLARLTETTPDQPVVAIKTAESWWDRRWARPFRQIAHHGIPLDLSLEPRKRGFAFGTGFPFRTLDRTGLPLPVRELPVVIPAPRSETFSLQKLLRSSRNGHHQVLTYSLAPASFGAYPDMQRFEHWVESFRHIRRSAHVVRNTRQLLGFWRGRLRSSLKSEIIEDVEIPTAPSAEQTDENSSEDGSTGLLLRITAEVERNDLSITIPESVRNRSFDQARRRASRVGGELVARKLQTETENVVGFDVRRIPIEAGSSRIDVYYR